MARWIRDIQGLKPQRGEKLAERKHWSESFVEDFKAQKKENGN